MKRSLKRIFASTAVAAGILFSGSAQGADKDIVDTAVAAGSFSTLAAALEAANLVEALKSDGPFTVFAPTDDAFAKLPAGTVENLLKPENKDQLTAVLTYHVVAGNVPAAQVVDLKGAKTLNGQRVDIAVSDGNVMVDSAKVVKTDIQCSNGIIHVVDSVILPAQGNLVATAKEAGSFNTLLAAAKAAGLVEALSGEGPLTVFAPTDEAFAKLPAGTVESLLKPENNAKLAAVLKYHVISGRVYSDAALEAKQATTLQGSDVRIRVTNGKAKVNDATLLKTDVDATNGVIHVIDSVLLPPADKDVSATQVHPVKVFVSSPCQSQRSWTNSHTAPRTRMVISTRR
ncbi:fasciclin domain-containing protein [Roseimaritima ulvae]|uniref:Immunogenic protein MPT70 n=1 Tax=Roseimaritima ulvae TaxID=980254 RepID=A0A5B9QT96_9BACT|nr:fasciclin domain-containing protein [Roseimaritima ulvae]QEG40960.1 Immunogenic protein MPT70 precursor [Roseimaritima ulvae]